MGFILSASSNRLMEPLAATYGHHKTLATLQMSGLRTCIRVTSILERVECIMPESLQSRCRRWTSIASQVVHYRNSSPTTTRMLVEHQLWKPSGQGMFGESHLFGLRKKLSDLHDWVSATFVQGYSMPGVGMLIPQASAENNKPSLLLHP